MTFLLPDVLWMLAGLPAAVGFYIWIWRTRRRDAIRYSHTAAIRRARVRSHPLRPHAPALLLLASLTAMVIAGARPVVGNARLGAATLVLALDISQSMGARDLVPNRLELARTVAKKIALDQPEDVRIGVVAFSATAEIAQVPTTERDLVLKRIDGLRLTSGSAVGTGLLGSLMVIFPGARLARGYDIFGLNAPFWAYPTNETTTAEQSPLEPLQSVEPALRRSAVIVLLSDGRSMLGVPEMTAAAEAARLGVKVFTIGIGTERGATMSAGGERFHADVNAGSLRAIAKRTGGLHFSLTTADDLPMLYRAITRHVTLPRTRHELAAIFAALGLACLLVAALLSLSRRPRPIKTPKGSKSNGARRAPDQKKRDGGVVLNLDRLHLDRARSTLGLTGFMIFVAKGIRSIAAGVRFRPWD